MIKKQARRGDELSFVPPLPYPLHFPHFFFLFVFYFLTYLFIYLSINGFVSCTKNCSTDNIVRMTDHGSV